MGSTGSPATFGSPWTDTLLAGLPDVPGDVDGKGSAAEFFDPEGLALDDGGNVYVADSSNNLIRKISSSGRVTTVAGACEKHAGIGFVDGPGWQPDGGHGRACFSNPSAVAFDTQGDLYVADTGNNAVRKLDPTGYVTTVAGAGPTFANEGFIDGPGTTADGGIGIARLNIPTDVAVDVAGDIYVADSANSAVRKIDSSGYVTTVAGNGQFGFADGYGGDGGLALFDLPGAIALDGHGNIYVADTWNNAIRMIDATGYVSTVAGNGDAGFADGTASAGEGCLGTALFNGPAGILVDTSGHVFVVDTGNDALREIAGGYVSTLLGADGGVLVLGDPLGIASGPGGTLVVDESNAVAILTPQ